jgi:hypothetical protein
MAELATRAEVEAAAAADAVHAAAAELKALRASSTDSSVSVDDDRDNGLKLAREAAREQATQWAACTPRGAVAAALTGADASAVLQAGARAAAVSLTAAAGLTEIAVFTGSAALPPGQVPWSPWDPGHCQGRRSRRRVAYPHQDQLRRVGRGDEGTTPGAAHVGDSSIRRRRLL